MIISTLWTNDHKILHVAAMKGDEGVQHALHLDVTNAAAWLKKGLVNCLGLWESNSIPLLVMPGSYTFLYATPNDFLFIGFYMHGRNIL